MTTENPVTCSGQDFLVLWEDGSRCMLTAEEIHTLSPGMHAWWPFVQMMLGGPPVTMTLRKTGGTLHRFKVLLPGSVPHEASFHDLS